MSFKRKGQAQITQLPGTRPSPLATSVLNISTGVPSLDDILGGGLPLGSVFVVLAPDPHAAYGDILQRYFVAQGVASGHHICILDNDAPSLAANCMWIPTNANAREDSAIGEAPSTAAQPNSSGVKIAWRYEKMKQFQTSVSYNEFARDAFSHPLDLTYRMPEDMLKSVVSSGHLCYMPVTSFNNIVLALQDKLVQLTKHKSSVLRVSIPDLGSPAWGDISPTDILRFLYRLRCLARRKFDGTPRICFFVSLPSYVSQDSRGGSAWLQKLGWLSDGCITLRSFSADPALLSIFPSHHGFIDIHNLPSSNSLVSPSDKFSELRGLSTFSSSTTGGGENNLAFKCTRKRFIIETLHLDVEGGVSERRTTAPTTIDIPRATRGSTAIEIAMEGVVTGTKATAVKQKAKKSVAFQSDRPDLYDF